ncbi:MAG: DUF58 domain-containing protein [Anaerolineae bacterium]
MSEAAIIDRRALLKLDRYTFVVRRIRAGAMKGERRSTRRGTSIEFADYRNYVAGDDLRRIDWNVFARLDRPYLKLYEEEEDLAVHLLLDASASMDFPREGDGNEKFHKFHYSQRVMAALAYIALKGDDQLAITALYGPRQNVTWGMARGRGRIKQALNYVEALRPAGNLELSGALKDYVSKVKRPGVAILISDLLSPNYQEGLTALRNAGHDVTVIHVLSPEEIEPPLAGDLQLIDVETGASADVTIDGSLRSLYQQRLLAWRDEIGVFCRKRNITYVTVETSTSWESMIQFDLRRLNVVK